MCVVGFTLGVKRRGSRLDRLYNPTRAVRTDRYKLVRNFWHLPEVYLTTDIYCSEAGQEVNELCYTHERDYIELYDLESDPHEHVNLAADPEYAAVRDRLDDELIDWMERTGDPLRDGPVVPSDWEAIQPAAFADRSAHDRQ